MTPNGLGIALATAALALGGCSLEKRPQATVLRNRDFLADPGTMPTEVASPPALQNPDAPPPAAIPTTRVITGTEASEGLVDIVARAEVPVSSASATPVSRAVLIDQKVGEINGKPIRVRDVFDDVGPRMENAARTRRLTAREWQVITGGKFDTKSESRVLTRDQWLTYATLLCVSKLNLLLEDELLEAEARASLKPEQKQGLAWLVSEATENLRRENAGSRAAADKNLESTGKTEQQYARDQETKLLIGYQLDERIRKKVRISWKDVQLYYERNSEIYNPPPVARFRMIRVPGNDGAAVEKIGAALASGEKFETVAGAAPNTFHLDEGGLLGDRSFTGDYATADFNLPATVQEAARTLAPGAYTRQPLILGRDMAWLYLESITQKSRPLSDRDVQLEIAGKLQRDAEGAERQAYIDHLKERASFSDLSQMVNVLVDAAAQRYWPKG